MTTKIGRFIPLSISAVIFIWFLINFKYFKLDIEQHYRFGAGMLYDTYGGALDVSPLAKVYLHLSLLLLFVGGIFLFAFHKRIARRALLIFSALMVIVFVLRPVFSLMSFYIQFPYDLRFVLLPTFKGQLIGRVGFEFQYDSLGRLQSLLGGIVLLLLLLINLILAFRHKQDPVYAQRKQQQRDMLNQQAQARQSAFAAQQQMQAQAFRQMPVPIQQQGVPTSMTQELERLQQMYNSGALTEEEFTVAKKRVLGN
jgi:hypothetical protein